MASQSGSNFKVAFKVQSALGTPASGSGGTGLYVRSGSGLTRNVALANSKLLRGDGQTLRPRHGSVSASGAFETELMVAALDAWFRAVLRSSAEVATFNITQADITSAAIGGTGTTITAASGSFVSLNARAGTFGKFTSMSTAANNDVWFPISTVAATVLTIPSGYLTDQAADSSFTLTLAKSVIQTDPPTERYFTIDEYAGDIDISKLSTDCKIHGLRFSAKPDEPIVIGFDVTGIDLDLAASGSSPSLTTPTFTDARPLYLADGALIANGTTYAKITGFDFNLALGASTVPVIGQRTSPDVFLGNAQLTGNLMATIEDDTFLALAQNETQVSAILRCSERETGPADFVGFYLPDLAFSNFDLKPADDGAAIQALPFVGGKDIRGTGYNASMITISSSSAAL